MEQPTQNFLTSDMQGACSCAPQTLQVNSINHTKLALVWALIQVNLDPKEKIGPKVGGGAFLRVGTLS